VLEALNSPEPRLAHDEALARIERLLAEKKAARRK
jgi:hypothetical protein